MNASTTLKWLGGVVAAALVSMAVESTVSVTAGGIKEEFSHRHLAMEPAVGGDSRVQKPCVTVKDD